MPGLRERKKQATRLAIHTAALRLFAARGFAGTTVDAIAAEADVSRATVFAYFPSKEDIVFGEAPQAVAGLASALATSEGVDDTLDAVRDWLRRLDGWLEPDLALQLRLAREVPTVGARRLRLFAEVERVIAGALARLDEPGDEFAARLAAAAIVAALRVAEETAAARMAADGRALSADEIDALLDTATAFARAGMTVARGR